MIQPECIGKWQVNMAHCVPALDLIAGLPDHVVGCLITDPPYGLAGKQFVFPHKRYKTIDEAWDTYAPTDWMQPSERVLQAGGSVICFGGRKSSYEVAAQGLSLDWRIVNDITWVKPDAPPNFTGRLLTETTERALWFCPDGEGWTYNLEAAKSMNMGMNLRDVWRFNIEREQRVHPSQKPLLLMERCILLFTKPGDLVIDPFCGSGTTGAAAIKHGRRFIGSDISQRYVDLSNRRLRFDYMPLMFETSEDAEAAQ